MHAAANLLAAALAAVGIAGCAPRPAWDPRSLGDIVPPVLERAGLDPSGALEMRFDEPVAVVEGSLLVDPPVQPPEVRASGRSIFLLVQDQVRASWGAVRPMDQPHFALPFHPVGPGLMGHGGEHLA